MAEELAAAHMRHIGFNDARRTGAGTDRGIDVVATNAAAQVKYLSAPVGGPDIQRFRGASHGIESALFYSGSGYSSAAVLAAERTGVALFTFSVENVVTALNVQAQGYEVTPLSYALRDEQIGVARAKLEALRAISDVFKGIMEDASAGRIQIWEGAEADISAVNVATAAGRALMQDEQLRAAASSADPAVRVAGLAEIFAPWEVFRAGMRFDAAEFDRRVKARAAFVAVGPGRDDR